MLTCFEGLMLIDYHCKVNLYQRLHLILLDYQLVILELTTSTAYAKQKPKQNIVLLNYTCTFSNLSTDIPVYNI